MVPRRGGPSAARPRPPQSGLRGRRDPAWLTISKVKALKGMTALDGLRIVPGYLDRAAQAAVRDALQDVSARAPLYTPRMPKTGKPMSVRMTNCGVTDV